MLIKIDSIPVFLTKEEWSSLVDLVLGSKSPRDLAREIYGDDFDWLRVWDPISHHIHTRISSFLSNQSAHDKRVFLAKHDLYRFEGNAASENVFDYLHACSLINTQIRIIPHQGGLSDDMHNQIALGTAWHPLLGNSGTLLFNLRPRSKFAWMFKSNYDLELSFNKSDVRLLGGRLTSPEIQLRDITFSFSGQTTISLTY